MTLRAAWGSHSDLEQEIHRGVVGGVVSAADGRPAPGGPAIIRHLFGVVEEIAYVHGAFTRACKLCE
jgi:hypothetical protein